MAAIARLVNALALFATCVVLLFVLYWQLVRGDAPGTLALMQRVALLGIGLGFLLNVRFGSSEAHFGIVIFSAAIGLLAAARQMIGYAAASGPALGAEMFGYHFCTWEVAGFFAAILLGAALLFIEGQFVEGVRDRRPSGAAQAVGWLFVLVALAHVVVALLQCGFEACVDGAPGYELLRR
ncbi:MAG: disulfide bond formation protein B [Burkholderiales bacterium]|nr:disulfide bond formation protein B [Burkholderiales bacterium]